MTELEAVEKTIKIWRDREGGKENEDKCYLCKRYGGRSVSPLNCSEICPAMKMDINCFSPDSLCQEWARGHRQFQSLPEYHLPQSRCENKDRPIAEEILRYLMQYRMYIKWQI